MLLYPEVQKRAQAEIDALVGRERLPSYDDKDSLEYLHCVFLETLRWHPAVPLGKLFFTTNSHFALLSKK